MYSQVHCLQLNGFLYIISSKHFSRYYTIPCSPIVLEALSCSAFHPVLPSHFSISPDFSQLSHFSLLSGSQDQTYQVDHESQHRMKFSAMCRQLLLTSMENDRLHLQKRLGPLNAKCYQYFYAFDELPAGYMTA